jgi:hypothetical protein
MKKTQVWNIDPQHRQNSWQPLQNKSIIRTPKSNENHVLFCIQAANC